MSFVCRELISEIRYYQRKKEVLEIEDFLRQLFDETPLYTREIQEIEERIDRLALVCADSM